ncbi:MAG TPA: hypothetical protein VF791_13925 [Pyrinomonadaceae bacterium]
MRQREELEHQSKVIDDNGLIRSRVPCPILKAIGARPGDHMIFRLDNSGKVIMRVSHSRGKSGGRKLVGGKRR